MPIPITCPCGRSMQVKDEMAGLEGKCPSCGKLLRIPLLPREQPREDDQPYRLADAPEEEIRPAPAPPRRKPVTRPKRDDASRVPPVVFEEGWFGSLNAGVAGGALMMLIAVAWFVAGLLLIERIFIYPFILFFIGFAALVRGLTGSD